MEFINVLTKTAEEIEEFCGVTFNTKEFYQPCYSNDGREEHLYIIPQKQGRSYFSG